VPPRLLLQSIIPNTDRLIAERTGDEKRRAENKARRAVVIARRQQRVDNIKWNFQAPGNLPLLDVLRAERVAAQKQQIVAAHLKTLGRTMRTRASDAKLRADEGSALGEVMAQLDAEDEEGEPSGSESDYEDEGAGGAPTPQHSANSTDEALSGAASTGDDSDNQGAGSDSDVADSSANENNDADTADEVENEAAQSSSDDGPPSGMPQKRHRKGNRKVARKSARTETMTSPHDEGSAEDGAFLEGFSCRWDSWEDFDRAFEEFQAATFQNFSSRTSTSVASRNNQMRNAIFREAETSGDTVKVVEQRKGTRYIPDDWQKFCKTLRCTHGRPQKQRGSGKRKHRKTRTTECSAKINARVVSGYSGWYLALKASGHHNHPVTKHQWFNYAENRTITDEGLTADVAKMHKAGAHAKGILAYLREQSGEFCTFPVSPQC
jgi:hypothetical protein